MAYMSKVKRRQVKRTQAIRALITVVIIAVVLIIVWQISLGTTYAKVGGVAIRGGMVKGVEAFLTYYQTGQFPNTDFSGKTDEEIQTAKDMELVQRNSLIQSVFIPYEVTKQHFKAQGTPFPDEETAADIKDSVDTLFANTELERTLRSNGVNRTHVEYYYSYLSAMRKLMEEALEKNPITPEEEQEYYERYISYFTNPLSLQASHILIMDSDHTAAKRAEIQDILDQLRDGADFAEMAMEYSEDSSAADGGDLGSFGLGQMVAPFEEAALALDVGEISDIVETEYGFHIIKLTDRTEESVQPLDEVKSSVEELIGGDRLDEELDRLKSEANTTYSGLINPFTGKPPINLTELEEIRNPGGTDTGAEDAVEEEDGDGHEGHDHE